MAKQHEILAVEKDLELKAATTRKNIKDIFTGQTELLIGVSKRLEMQDAERKFEEDAYAENREIAATVQKLLDDAATETTRALDVFATKEATNQVASADVEIDGVVILDGNSAPMLVGLESRLEKIKELYLAIPTLAPGQQWVEDPAKGDGVYRVEMNPRVKNEKVLQHKILHPATKEHPPNIREWSEDKCVGKYYETRWSGAWTIAKKASVLERIDQLIMAVKQARMRANDTDIKKKEIGRKIFGFLHA
jgi:hypothetical protein